MSLRRSYHSSPGLPGRRGRLLLRAALLADQRAADAWAAWAEASRGSPTPAEERLLPLAEWNLTTLGADGASLRAAALARSHVANRNTLAWALPVLWQISHELETPIIPLKGMSLALAVYPSWALRPIGDIDILLPIEVADKACLLLQSDGWRPDVAVPASARPHFPSAGYVRGDGLSIDIHHAAAAELSSREIARSMLDGAREWPLYDIPTRRLPPEDELIVACLHGLHWRPGGCLHWAADAAMILRATGGGFNWDRLVETATLARCRFSVSVALGFLQEDLEIDVPQSVVTALRERINSLERLEYFLRVRTPSLLRGLLIHAFNYRRLGLPSGSHSFARYMRDQWGVAAGESLTLSALGRIGRRLREGAIR